MTLIKPGQGVTDISGSMAGNVFARDSSGLHVRSKPRRVNNPTPAQRNQRNAFAKARLYSSDHRTVSYLIYRALNNLPFIFDAIVTGDPVPDCTGKYLLAGTYNGQDYYKRTDSTYFIWYWTFGLFWIISDAIDEVAFPMWYREQPMLGTYNPLPPSTGHAKVQLQVQPPPPDYKPPGL